MQYGILSRFHSVAQAASRNTSSLNVNSLLMQQCIRWGGGGQRSLTSLLYFGLSTCAGTVKTSRKFQTREWFETSQGQSPLFQDCKHKQGHFPGVQLHQCKPARQQRDPNAFKMGNCSSYTSCCSQEICSVKCLIIMTANIPHFNQMPYFCARDIIQSDSI